VDWQVEEKTWNKKDFVTMEVNVSSSDRVKAYSPLISEGQHFWGYPQETGRPGEPSVSSDNLPSQPDVLCRLLPRTCHPSDMCTQDSFVW